ncbi:MAG: acyl-ACP--UDP-N-acetylglucosamine O-acyltransferase [Alphaproteobacteria bacterium]
MTIHDTAIIDKTAKIGNNVVIGPYTVIGENVVIGDDVVIKNNTTIHCNTTIGNKTKISSYASLGGDPQDISFKETDDTYLEIGENCDIREFTSINRGTNKDNRLTKIGNNCLIMSNVHIGHDCVIANNVIISTSCGLAGHCKIEDNVVLGGMTGLHHHLRIGKFTMIGGHMGLRKDVMPYSLLNEADTIRSANVVGLTRAGASKSDIVAITKAIKKIQNKDNVLSELAQSLLNSDNEYIKEIGEFISAESKLGLAR